MKHATNDWINAKELQINIENKTKYSRRWSFNYILKALTVIWKVNGVCGISYWCCCCCCRCRYLQPIYICPCYRFNLLRMKHFKSIQLLDNVIRDKWIWNGMWLMQKNISKKAHTLKVPYLLECNCIFQQKLFVLYVYLVIR